jgi:Brp/Blh family beta-carotene 15,15'-monooxygenase
MNKNLLIILSFVSLWISSIVSETYETFLGLFLIISFGILHGSNDILLLQKNIKINFNTISQIQILTFYVATILVIISGFYLLPQLALLSFVFISAYHFGEQHWNIKLPHSQIVIKHSIHISYGLSVLLGLFILNIDQVREIIYSICNFNITHEQIIISLLASGSILIASLAYGYYKKWLSTTDLLYEILIGVILYIIFSVSTLIWGFAIYFIFWHSLPSLNDQIQYVYGNTATTSVKKYILKALPYWAVSIIGLGLFYFILKDEKLLYAILFSFIAAITFPHAYVIYKTFKHKKTLPN